MIEYIKSLFRPTVSKLVADIQSKVAKLEALVIHHSDKSDALAFAAAAHAVEATKAAKIAGKLGDLIS